MIGTKTTFVIGAGASCPYGLPSGKQLKELANGLKNRTRVYWLVRNCLEVSDVSALDGFLERLGGAGVASIDASGNKVNFMTFNFDTVVEDVLRRLVESGHHRAPENFPWVIHVHGKLPTIPDGPVPEQVPYYKLHEPNNWKAWLIEAAPKIHIVTEDIPPETRNAVQQATAEAVYFLGFAYAPENLKKLFGEVDVKKLLDSGKVRMFGSAKRITPNHRNKVSRTFDDNTVLGASERNCRQFLEEYL